MKITAEYGYRIHRPTLAVELVPPPPPTLAERAWDITKKVTLYTAIGGIAAVGIILKPHVFIGAFVTAFVVVLASRR